MCGNWPGVAIGPGLLLGEESAVDTTRQKVGITFMENVYWMLLEVGQLTSHGLRHVVLRPAYSQGLGIGLAARMGHNTAKMRYLQGG